MEKVESEHETTRLRGRPTLLTPEVQKLIVTALQAGNYFSVACRFAGISPDLGAQWLQRGTPGTKVYQDMGPRAKDDPETLPNGDPYPGRYLLFTQECDRAQAYSEFVAVSSIHLAAKRGEWRASVEYLRRKFPERWREEVTIEHTTGEQVSIRAPKDDVDQVAAIANVLQRAGIMPSQLHQAIEHMTTNKLDEKSLPPPGDDVIDADAEDA